MRRDGITGLGRSDAAGVSDGRLVSEFVHGSLYVCEMGVRVVVSVNGLRLLFGGPVAHSVMDANQLCSVCLLC